MEKLYTIVYVKVHVYVHVHKIASSKQGHYNLKMKRFEIIFSCSSILLDSSLFYFILFSSEYADYIVTKINANLMVFILGIESNQLIVYIVCY